MNLAEFLADENRLREAWEVAETDALAPLFGNPQVIEIVFVY